MNINAGYINTHTKGFNSIVNYNKENYADNDIHNKQYDMFIEESQLYKLTLRKKTLFDDLMKRRLKHNNSNNNESKFNIEHIGSIIHEGMSLKKNDVIDKGICLLLKYIENNENTFHSKQKKYLLENIYYSLLDIFKHYNQYHINILHIFISLTAIDEIFISNLMNDNIISYLSPIITNYSSTKPDDKYYLSLILLSNCMVDNITNYNLITTAFDFGVIIHNLISTNLSYVSDEYGDVVLIVMSAFLCFLPKQHMYSKYKAFAEFILHKKLPHIFNDSYDSDSIDDIIDILVLFAKNRKIVETLIDNGILYTINRIINELPTYVCKGYLLLSKLLVKCDDIQKQKMFPHAESALPFMNELMISITNATQNVKLITNIFHCVRNMMVNSFTYTKMYFLHQDFITFLIGLFMSNTTPNTIKTEILILFIVAMNHNNTNNQIQALLYKSNICKYVIQYINDNYVNKISDVFLYNALSLMELFLIYGEALNKMKSLTNNSNGINYIKIEMDNYNFSKTLEMIITSSHNAKLTDKAKSIDIKYWSEDETYYEPLYKMKLDSH